jgi:hypothetical protein
MANRTLFDTEGLFWSGYQALRGALVATGPWLQGAYPSRGLERTYPQHAQSWIGTREGPVDSLELVYTSSASMGWSDSKRDSDPPDVLPPDLGAVVPAQVVGAQEAGAAQPVGELRAGVK